MPPNGLATNRAVLMVGVLLLVPRVCVHVCECPQALLLVR